MNDLAISRGGPISDATCYFDYKDLDAAQRKGARDSQPIGLSGVACIDL